MEKKFSEVGEITFIKIPRDPSTKMTRKFGFISFKTGEMAKKAVELFNNSEFDGNKIKVEISRRDAPRPKTPGRYLGIPKKPYR